MSQGSALDSPAEAGRRRQLGRLVRPRHVAVIGGDAAEEAARQLDAMGFGGAVWPVNPRRRYMAERACFANVAGLPEGPDAAIVATPAAACPEVFAALHDKGAGGGICFAAGFAEAGNTALEACLVQAAGDVALVGPNCHGIINCLDRGVLWPDNHGAVPADVGCAFISQSGNVALSATFQQRSVPFGYVIGTGNQAQLGVEDFIGASLEDPRIRAIGLFIEGLRDVAAFARVARRALEAEVPIVALKVGASQHGARAAQSHTAAFTGADDVYTALFERLGVRRAGTLTELLETLKLLSVTGAPEGRRVISLSCSGGEAAMIGDRLEAAGLECPPLQDEERIAEAFRIPAASVSNPLDYNTRVWGDTEASKAGFEAALAAEHDCGTLVLDFPPGERCRADNWRSALDAFLRAPKVADNVRTVLATLPEGLSATARSSCLEAGVVPLQGLDDGIHALAHGVHWQARRRELCAQAAWPGPPPPRVDTPRESLNEASSKAWLAEYGVPVPAAKVVNAAGVADAAATIGFPVVLKALAAGVAHKSDLGAVHLGLETTAQVRQAAVEGSRRLEAAGYEPRTWLIEPMVNDVVGELLVGITRDFVGGLVLVLGSGGVLTELVGDTRTLLLPVSSQDIQRALASLTVGRVLGGYRGDRGGDTDAAVSVCSALAQFALDHADVLGTLEVNPLLVRAPGCGAVAADAVIERGSSVAERSMGTFARVGASGCDATFE